MLLEFVLLVLAISVLLLAIAAARAIKVMASHHNRLATLERKRRHEGAQANTTHAVTDARSHACHGGTRRAGIQ
jgi:hypothetical protein